MQWQGLSLVHRCLHEAVLYDRRIFHSKLGEHRYDAVDGVGYLLLAMIALDTDRKLEMIGSGRWMGAFVPSPAFLT